MKFQFRRYKGLKLGIDPILQLQTLKGAFNSHQARFIKGVFTSTSPINISTDLHKTKGTF